MPTPVKLRVVVQEPGWAMVSFTKPPEDDGERKEFLQRTLQDWVTNEQCVVDKVLPIRFKDKLYGLNVFFTAVPKGEVPHLHLNVHLDASMQKKYGKEYLEAVVSEVAQFMSKNQLKINALALTNHREITVIVDRREQKAFILPLEHFRKQIEPKIAKDLDKWLAATNVGFFCVPVQKRKK